MKKLIFSTILLALTFVQTSSAQEAKNTFGNLTTAYFEAKNALAKDKLADASLKAMAESVKAFPSKTLDATQNALWIAQSAEINKALAAMSTETVLKQQREQFKNVSYAMIKLVKGLKLNSQTIYLQHCPMAKASWLNEVEAVQNPYYGSMMYDCGDVKETIAKN